MLNGPGRYTTTVVLFFFGIRRAYKESTNWNCSMWINSQVLMEVGDGVGAGVVGQTLRVASSKR